MEFRIEVDSVEETCKLFIYEEWTRKQGKEKLTKKILAEEPIATVDFVVTDTVEVTSLAVKEEYQKRGYGRLIMDIMFSLSVFYNKPVELTSVDDAIPFYKRIGMKLKRGTVDVFVWQPKKKL